MNIHEAVLRSQSLHSSTVIVRQQQAGAGRQKSEISARLRNWTPPKRVK